jgi:phage repressor protein C with HTH and peptisase S24 domain
MNTPAKIRILFISTKHFVNYFLSLSIILAFSMEKRDILEQLISHYANGNKAKFATLLGVSPQSISTWLARNTFDVDKIYANCVGVSGDWLLTGDGSMLKGESLPVAHQITSPKEGIPLIPLSAMAGALTGEQTVLEYECERYVVPAFNGADFLIPVKGNSMTPTYVSGDIVACQRVPMTDLFFQWNKPYVLDTAQGPLIKRIKPGSDREHVLIVSDNESYNPFELPLSDIHAVALVVGIIRLE